MIVIRAHSQIQSQILTSPLAPAVASNSERKGLNWSALMAPLCFDVRDMCASLSDAESILSK